MVSRRQQKVASVIRESVSDTIVNRLSDPRIEGFVSVTAVSVSPDLKQADIGLSIFANTEEAKTKTFRAIEHATSFIQRIAGEKLSLRYCPYLSFYVDSKIAERLETLDIIDKLERERDEGIERAANEDEKDGENSCQDVDVDVDEDEDEGEGEDESREA